ncbi:F0F1 ATP synthase subunit B family protein [Cyclobacterium qasimii]|uniref:ATP synthase subunit b n=2 Tax=Cyclobacterium qasimii TaxID=1350429 RepID=S7V8Z2_9BACT|nr:ATP synthase B chain [Cyclobacterium qasimii]EPR66371.1 ATP synthase B chain [Cyclobacterium qasimii M12-11B]GEO21159.1 hypothetical protein CQA01_16930 [Cyclobacterium qasimii]
MNIDWFTLIAQIINFILLMWLLKRFLYKPILAAIDKRETNIKNQLLDATSQKKEATKAQDEFNQKNESFDKQKAELMQKAVSEAKVESEKLKETARNEANVLKEKLEKAFTEDQASKNNNIAKRIGDEVLNITRKTLTDLSSASLEEQTLKVLLIKLDTLNEEDKIKFAEALKEGSKPIVVQSAFELSTDQQAAIQKSVNAVLNTEATYEFVIRQELINGIEILTNGFKLSWSIYDYLESFQNEVDTGKKVEIETKSK